MWRLIGSLFVGWDWESTDFIWISHAAVTFSSYVWWIFTQAKMESHVERAAVAGLKSHFIQMMNMKNAEGFLCAPALPMALGAICRTMKRLHSEQNITSSETQWLRDTPRMWCHMLETAVWANAFLLMHMRPLGQKRKVIKQTLKSKTIARWPAGNHFSSA